MAILSEKPSTFDEILSNRVRNIPSEFLTPENLIKLGGRDSINRVFDEQDGKCYGCRRNAIQMIVVAYNAADSSQKKFLGFCGNCCPEANTIYTKKV